MDHGANFRKWEAMILSVGFMLALAVPLTMQFGLPAREIAASEGRKLAKFPLIKKAHWKYIREFPQTFDHYYDDRFGGRNDLLAAAAVLKVKVFQTSPTKDVMIGKDGWLFYTGDGSLDDYRGLTRFSEAELRDWKEYLERRQAWLAKRNMRYIFFFAPDKQSIYPEFMPDRAAKVRAGTALDQLIAYLQKNCSVPVLDLRQPLREAKPLGQLYWKTDTHWMYLGAYAGYRELSEQLRSMFPQIQTSKYFIGKHPERIVNETDLKRVMGLPGTPVERVPPSNFKFGDEPSQRPSFVSNALRADTLTYSIQPPNPETSLKVVVYRDSFFNGLLTSFCPHFAKSTYVWRKKLRSEKQEQALTKLVEQEQPQLFVEEMLERFASTAPDPKIVFGGESGEVALPTKSP
jgi:hypothetical protein